MGGILVAGYSNGNEDHGKTIASGIPNFVHCRRQKRCMHDASLPVPSFRKKESIVSPQEWNDPYIDHAAGLLLSLADAAG